MQPLQVVSTSDGSSSVYNPAFDGYYHSRHGAIQESEHVFMAAGLNRLLLQQKHINVLEIGFGTGLNALLTYYHARQNGVVIHYTSLEKFPLDESVYTELNYAAQLQLGEEGQRFFLDLHKEKWNTEVSLRPDFILHKRQMDIQDFNAPEQFELIYFDAFAPTAQPELWSDAVFVAMYHALRPSGILVTYCAKGEVKRAMKRAGFTLEALPGPPGKREMTRALKIL